MKNIGIDMIELSRMAKTIEGSCEVFLKKDFSNDELQKTRSAYNPSDYFASAFADVRPYTNRVFFKMRHSSSISPRLPHINISKISPPPDVQYFDVDYVDGRILLKPLKMHGTDLGEVRAKIKSLGLSEDCVDTNVLVNGLLFGGKPGELVKLWKKGRVVPLCSKEIVKEYLRVLAYPKFQLSESEIDFLLTHEILPYFEALAVKPGKPFETMDPSDDKFVWCAIKGRAEVIASGYEHLLNLSPSPVPVTTVKLFTAER